MRLDGILALEDRIYQIGEVAELFGLTTRAIRFYEEEGLVEPIRQGRGRRKYARKQIERIDMIVSCRQVGISMDTISELIALRDKGDERAFQASLADALAERREQIEDEIVTLNHQRRLIAEWSGADATAADDDDGAGSAGSNGGGGEHNIRLVSRGADARRASYGAPVEMDIAFSA